MQEKIKIFEKIIHKVKSLGGIYKYSRHKKLHKNCINVEMPAM